MLDRIRKHLLDVLIFGSHRPLIGTALWLAAFLVLLAVLATFWTYHVRDVMRRSGGEDIAQLETLRANVEAAFDKLRSDVTAEPCSEEFHKQLRRVAFAPDGLNEFLYAPRGVALCSTSNNLFAEPVAFDPPDVPDETRLGTALWIDRDLEFIGLNGVRATIVMSGPFAIVLPPPSVGKLHAEWLSKELVLVAEDGRWWRRAGDFGLYAQTVAADHAGAASLRGFREMVCDRDRVHCVAEAATLGDLVKHWAAAIAAAIALAAGVAVWIATRAQAALARYWSLEARFRRHMTPESVVCAYQPITDMRTGAISGCEVLARWRDVNGTIVMPNDFIGIVERAGLTRRFTKKVVGNAFRELSTRLPDKKRLRVNFNIAPRDLDSLALCELFADFLSMPERFAVVVEIVESDDLPIEAAQREIEALARAGIETYIDDFGSGYSNIQNLASLAVHGVKLDRSFAMAPESSMMAKMLVHALDMIETSGRVIVVEGVETEERLDLLRRTGQVDYVQGYLISRPLLIDAFLEFLARRDGTLPKAA